MNRLTKAVLFACAYFVPATIAPLLFPSVGAPEALVAQAREDTERQQLQLSNAVLTFHIIEADGFETVDPAISDVVDELRNLFRYEGYRLHSTSVVNAGLDDGGRSSVSQMIATPGNPNSQYRISAHVAELRSSDEPKIRVHVELQEGHPSAYRSSGDAAPVVVSASVNLSDQQTVVLGSARPHSDSAAIILVLTPELERR